MSNQPADQAAITEEAVRKALATVQEPELHNDLVTLNMVRDIAIERRRTLASPSC